MVRLSAPSQSDQPADDIEKRKRQRQKKAREERRRERRIEMEENKKQGKCKFRNLRFWLVRLCIIVEGLSAQAQEPDCLGSYLSSSS